MSIAHDATSGSHTGTSSSTGDFSWTHTPVGTPRGVLVLIVLNAEAIDEIAGVTYGGQAMTEVALSPLLHATGSEDGTVYGYFLGSSVPAGAQTVQVTTSGSTRAKTAQCMTMTAAKDTAVDDTTTLESGAATDPAVSLDTTAEAAIYAALHSGASTAGVAPDGNTTQLRETTFTGTFALSFARRTSNASGAGSFSVGWTSSSDEQAVLGVAIREVFEATGSATASARPQATASGQKGASGSATGSAHPTVTASGFGPTESHSGSATVSHAARVVAASDTSARSGSASATAATRATASGATSTPSAFTRRSAMML